MGSRGRVEQATARSDAWPHPPLDLATRVSSLEGREDPLAAYEQLGQQTKASLISLLPGDWDWAGKRCLDFGCGAGRTLRQFLPEAASAEFWGAELDASSVAWLQGHLCPPLSVVRSEVEPPLPFEDESFDLAWAISVFTHLADNSLPWLAELHRVLKPGGLLMASYMGSANSFFFDPEPWDEDRIGMNVLRHDNPWDNGGPMVLMSDWWVKEHWGRGFEVVSTRLVHDQSWALLRRRPGAITAEELGRTSDDPRELAALKSNIRQLRLEVETAHADLRAAYEQTAAVRAAYEDSLSWRVTRPLRDAALAGMKRLRG